MFSYPYNDSTCICTFQTQVKFVWGICTYRDQAHDSRDIDEWLNDLEASGNGRSDEEFGFELKRNGKNEAEIRTQVTDMCSDVYADVVRQGIVTGDDISNNAETGSDDDDEEEGGTGTNDNDGTDPGPSPVASPTALAVPTSPSVPNLGPSDDTAPATAPAVDQSPTSSPAGAPTTVSADYLDGVIDDDTAETIVYFDVFFAYRMEFSDESMTAKTVESEYGDIIKSTIASVLQDEGVSRRLALSLSSGVADPIENVNYADSYCPEASDTEDAETFNSCVLVVSLVRVEAEKDTEDQNSAKSAIQTPLRVSMAPISDTFEESVGIDDLIRVEWVSGAPGQDATVSLGTDGTNNNKSLSHGGIFALAVCLTVLLAGGIFATGQLLIVLFAKKEEDGSSYHDVDDVEAQELRSASVSKDLSSSKPIATGVLSNNGDELLDHDVEMRSAAASVPHTSGAAEGCGDWAACGATAAILASAKSSIGDEVSSIAPSSRVPTPSEEEDHAVSMFTELLFDLPPKSLSTGHPSQESLASLVASESVPQLSPQGEALNCTRSLCTSTSTVSEAAPATDAQARSSYSLSGVDSSLNSTANRSLPAKNAPTLGYTGITMAGAAATGIAMSTSNRNGDDQSFDGSIISDKPSEADDRFVASKSALLSPEQIDGLNRRVDTALNTGDWANVLTEANAITEHAEEASTKESTNASDEASQRTTKSTQSFLGRLFGGGANDDTKTHVSTGAGAGALAVVAGTAAVAVASSSSDKTAETPQKSNDDYANTAQDDIVLAQTQSSEGSPNISSPPDESSSDSAFTNFGSDSAVASLGSSLFVDPNASVSETNNSQISAGCPLIADKEDTKRKKSPKNLFSLGSKKSSSNNVPTSGKDEDSSPKSSWKRKLGFGGNSKSASDAIDNKLAMLEDSSVESRSLGSDAMNEDDIASSMSGVAAAPRSATLFNAGSFAAATLVTSSNALNDVSSDIYASSASASIPADHDADVMSHRSFADDLDVAIETGNWDAVEEAAANMLDGISSSNASSRTDGGISSAASSDFHSAGSHFSSSRGGSSIGNSTANTAKIKALEHAIENNNWQRVLELSGKYKKEVSEDGESPKGAAAAAAWAIDRSFQDQIGEGEEENVSGGDEL